MKTNAEIAQEIIEASWGDGDTSLVRRIELALQAKDEVSAKISEDAGELIKIADKDRDFALFQERELRRQVMLAKERLRISAAKITEYLTDENLFRGR